jgi:hypothetical protein
VNDGALGSVSLSSSTGQYHRCNGSGGLQTFVVADGNGFREEQQAWRSNREAGLRAVAHYACLRRHGTLVIQRALVGQAASARSVTARCLESRESLPP